MSWTARFGLALLAMLGLIAVETEWFSLIPGSSEDLIGVALVVALIALYAARVTPLGAALALFAAIWLLYLDQATLGLGVPPLPFVPPLDFWITTVLRASLAWAAFALIAGHLGKRLPRRALGAAVAVALLVLPFLRHGWSDALSVLLDPAGGRYVVLSVPWLPLVVLTSLLTTAVVLVPARRRALALGLATLLAVAAPLTAYAYEDVQLGSALDVSATVVRPLDKVTVRTRFTGTGQVEALWDGQPMVAGPGLVARPFRSGDVTSFTFYPGAQVTVTPGRHDVELAQGADVRDASVMFAQPLGGLTIAVDPDGVVRVHGPTGGDALLLVRDERGLSQMLSIRFDAAGTWRAQLPLPHGRFSLAAQSGAAWTAANVDLH